jgi:hypothetical protein
VAQDRRYTSRLIMRVPMHVRSLRGGPQQEHPVESMNISIRGVYFATDAKFEEKEEIEIRLHMPEQLMAGQITDWCFTGRVAHVHTFGKNTKRGVGVQFLYYSAGEKKFE